MKAVIVGAGGMGRAWGKNIKSVAPEVDIVGWVDLLPDSAASAASELELTGIYTGDDCAKAIGTQSPDFVVDVSVPEAHCEVTLLALQAGVPVLGEKPMAASMEEARKMVAASEKAGKLYMVSQSRRYDKNLHAYRGLIEQVGRLGILNSDFYIGAHFGGFRDQMRSPLVLDMGIHTFDAARYLSHADPVAVYCEEFNPPWSWYSGDAAATAIFEMADGLRYTYRGSWCSEGRNTSWEAEWRAVGEHGTATWDGVGANKPVLDLIQPEPAFIRHSTTVYADVVDEPAGIAGSLLEFLNALKTGTVPQGECHDNIKSLAMVFAAMESSDTKARIPVRW